MYNLFVQYFTIEFDTFKKDTKQKTKEGGHHINKK